MYRASKGDRVITWYVPSGVHAGKNKISDQLVILLGSFSIQLNMVHLSTNYLLYDLDGTLVNSTPSVEQTWKDTIVEHNRLHPDNVLDPVEFLHSAHGTRTIETFQNKFPYRPASPEDIGAFEIGIVKKYGHLAKPVPGVPGLFLSLNTSLQKHWAIVTSGTTGLAHSWFDAIFKPENKPPVFITANDVTHGKPDPEGYLTAFGKLCKSNGTNPETSTAIVFEDAPTGIKAGVNGKFLVVGIATTFGKEALLAAGAKYVIEDMTKVKVSLVDGVVELQLEIL